MREEKEGMYEYTGLSREGWDCEKNPEKDLWRRTKESTGFPCPYSHSCEYCKIMEMQVHMEVGEG